MGASTFGGEVTRLPSWDCLSTVPSVGRWAWLSSASALSPLGRCVYGDGFVSALSHIGRCACGDGSWSFSIPYRGCPCGDSWIRLLVSSLLPPCCLGFFDSHWSIPTPDGVGGFVGNWTALPRLVGT